MCTVEVCSFQGQPISTFNLVLRTCYLLQRDRVAEMQWQFDHVKLYWEPYQPPGTGETFFKVCLISSPSPVHKENTEACTVLNRQQIQKGPYPRRDDPSSKRTPQPPLCYPPHTGASGRSGWRSTEQRGDGPYPSFKYGLPAGSARGKAKERE